MPARGRPRIASSTTMACIVRKVTKEEWHGRFWGTWQGVDFDYEVDFFGPPEHLHGKAIVDGATYEWKGRMNAKQFRANFGGDRYSGSFDLKRDDTPGAVTRNVRAPL